MKTLFFSPKKVLDERQTSPARVYTDGFLYENLPTLLPKKEISVLDIGCGSGYVRKIFHDLGYRINYTGIDVYRHKEFDQYKSYAASCEFIESPIETFNTEKKFDFIMSMFAMEHIEDDHLAVKKVNDMMAPDGVQFHMVPSKYSFLVYFRHGYRRYSPTSLQKMFGQPTIYRICGLASFTVHFLLITVMKRLFKNTTIYRSSWYQKILTVANHIDRWLPIFEIAYIIVDKKSYENN